MIKVRRLYRTVIVESFHSALDLRCTSHVEEAHELISLFYAKTILSCIIEQKL